LIIFDIFSKNGNDFWKKWIKQTDVSRINAMLVPWFEKILMKIKHDAIYTISNASKDDIIKMHAKKPIYNIPPTIRDEIQLNEKINPFQFICIGRLVFYKNLEVIIKAMSIVIKTIPECRLMILGDGPHRESLQILTQKLGLEKNIIFNGYATSEEKMRVISQSNAMLFPSIIEGFGLVILESFSQNKPVLVSNISPMSDIITHNTTGFVLDAHNENVWAEHIIKLIKNPQESQIMGKNGNQVLKENYNQETFYGKLIEMYNLQLRSDMN